jgi:hypothetical protein
MTNHANSLSGDRTALPDGPALDVTGIPAEAFIYPDEPLVLDKFRTALIHPDEPLTPREEERGIVVGMDGSAEHEAVGPGAVLLYADPVLLDADQVADLLDAVSNDLRKNGIDSLRREGGASSVQANLMTHLAQYFSKK